ncbi:MAG: ABC transporter permease [Muribaculaceae bacterium]|nr:ABC transporter permease [Muribaculaceae bacterium]
MNYPLFLARRLSLSSDKRKNSPAVSVAIISVAISVAVMIASIAIVLGFKQEIREKVVGFNGHITIFRIPNSEGDDNLITLNRQLQAILEVVPFVRDYSLTASIPAIMKTQNDFKGVYLKGMQGHLTADYLEKNLEEGEIPDFSDDNQKNRIVISRLTANKLNLKAGDKIDTYFMTDDIRARKLEVAGIYNSHFDQYDDILIFGDMSLISQLGNVAPNTGTYISVMTDNFDKIEEYTFQLQDYLNQPALQGKSDTYYKTDNVLSQGRGFFSWLSLLDTNVAVIIILMMIVGCVTLISGMLIIILERKKFIGLMRALGASTAKIRNVFIYMAIKIAFIGIAIGDIIVLILLYLQDRYHFLPLEADSYYIDYVPVYLPTYIVVALNSGVLLVTYLVLVLPSRFVGKISPAESMVRA